MCGKGGAILKNALSICIAKRFKLDIREDNNFETCSVPKRRYSNDIGMN